MKARMCSVYRSNEMGLNSGDSYRIGKHDARSDEMQQCFSKLKQIVPTVNKDQKVTKVQLLQHVIDYIMDLELTLQYQQPTAAASLLVDHRKPLCENSYLNTMASHLEAINLGECDSSTVST